VTRVADGQFSCDTGLSKTCFCSLEREWVATHRLLGDGSLNAVRFIFRNALPTRWAVLGRAGIDNESDQVPEGRSVDALARAGDEGRGTLRKAVGSCEQALIRGYPNGETHFQRSVVRGRRTEGANLSAICLLSSDL
jgi:hypothetical protein